MALDNTKQVASRSEIAILMIIEKYIVFEFNETDTQRKQSRERI